MYRPLKRWEEVFKEKNLIWVHSSIKGLDASDATEQKERLAGGNWEPHIKLTSGMHSNGYFNGDLITQDSLLLDEASSDLVELLRDIKSFGGVGWNNVDMVIGPAMGAVKLAGSIAFNMSKRSGRSVFSGYAEKSADKHGNRVMVFERTPIRPNKRYLICEDVVTTGGSVRLVADAILEQGGFILPYVPALCNRSGTSEIDGRKIVALYTNNLMQRWDPSECRLCRQGSEVIRPKSYDAWGRLSMNEQTKTLQ